MDEHSSADNSQKPDDFSAIPIFEPKKPKKPAIYFIMGFLAALLIAGCVSIIATIAAYTTTQQSPEFLFAEPVIEAENQLNVVTASTNLTPVTTNDVNSLRFYRETVTAIYIQTSFGNVTVEFHDEDYVFANSSLAATHIHDETARVLKMESNHGDFVVKLPKNAEIAIGLLHIQNPFGHTVINSLSADKAMVINNLYMYTSHGSADLLNLHIPWVLYVETGFGNINITDVLSNNQMTQLNTGEWGRITTN